MKTTLLAATLALSLNAQNFERGKLDQFLDRLAEKNKGMGSLVLTKNNGEVYSRAFGYSQIEGDTKKPNTSATKFHIGSITKTFTAVMIFQSIEANKLKLSDTLDKFFPEIPNASRITIAQILQHRSGIQDLGPGGGWGRQARTREERIAHIAQAKPEFEPDTRHSYSNAGYILLGFVLEKIEGKAYAEILKQRITGPLGLKDTNVETSENNLAHSYRYINAWTESPEVHPSVTAGAGSIVSTPSEMAKFIYSLFEGKLVSAASLKQMTTIRDEEGMGLEAPYSFAGKTFYGHTGGSNAAGAWVAYSPEDKVALAYATNAKIYPVKDIVAGALEIYYNRPFEIPTFEAFAVATELLDSYAGVYVVAGTPARIVVARSGSTLTFQPPNSTPVTLEATTANTFKFAPFLTVEFDAAKKEMTVIRAGQKRLFTKE